jgi:repressor LexA
MSTYQFTRANIDETVNKIYNYIVSYINQNGYPPAVRDICNGVGIKSTSTIHSHLKRLQDAGRIEYSAGKRRAINIPDNEQSKVKQMPLIGQVTAGVPILAHENIERTLPFPADYFSDHDEIFALKVRGDSMINAAILDGDIVIVKKQNTANNGDIIVALVEDEATVKTLVNKDGRIYLMPQNEAYSPIPFDRSDCKVLGKVCGIFRTPV